MKKIYSLGFVVLLLMAANLTYSQSTQVSPFPYSTQVDAGVQCSGGQIHDDGVAENGYGWNATAGDPSAFCTKFIPTGYPYKFSKYCIALTRLATGVANWNFKIMMWKSVNGAPGTKMDSVTVTATAVPVWPTVSFFDFVLPGTWADVTGSDSVFIGIVTNPVTQTGVFVASDESVTTPIWPGWATTAAGPWQSPSVLWAGYRAFLQRAEGSVSTPPIPTGTWTEQTSGVTGALYSISAVNDDVAWTCGATGKVLRTTNKGVNWVNVSGTLPVAAALYNIYAWDANTAVVTGVTGSNTSIYQTSNGGTTWTVANTHAGFGDDMFMTDANTAYFIGDPSGGNWDLLKSTNAGLNWSTWATVPTTNTAGTYNNAFCTLGQQVWFPSVGLSQMVYSSNMGANWSLQTLPLTEITATWFNSATVGIAGGSSASAGLLITTNSGTNWTTLTQSFVGATSVAAITGAGTSWWVAKQDTTIWYSADNGVNWAKQYRGPGTSAFYHMTKSRSGATLWAVRSTGGISRYGQPISGIAPIGNEIPIAYSVSQNYPNPFNPTTKINFALPKSGLVSIKIYDILGKEVATLVNEVKNAGNYTVDFNASAFSSGTYFYRLESNGFVDTKKMTLLK